MTRAACWLVFTGCMMAAGCGGGGAEVTGKVLKGSEPYTLGEGEGISINLNGDGKTAGGTVEKDGSFVIKGDKGGGVPAGKYKVSVVHYRPADPKKGPVPPSTKDIGETWDVGGSSKEFTIDMAKYK